MAVPGLTTTVYLFAIISMATGVVILAHFLSTKNEISFAVVYIWKIAVIFLAFLAMLRLVLLRNNPNHFEKIDRQQNCHTRSKITRDLVILFCGAGSGILPLYEAFGDLPCIGPGKGHTVFVSRFISFVMSGIFYIVEFVFLACCGMYRCKSGHARMLISVIMSTNVCMVTNFILNIIRASNTSIKQQRLDSSSNVDLREELVFSYCENKTERVENATFTEEQIYKYTNTFIIEFGLFAFGILGPMWNIIVQPANSSVNQTENNGEVSGEENTSDDRDGDTMNLISQNDSSNTSAKFTILKTLHFVSSHAFKFSLLFALPVLGFHIYSEVENMVRYHSDVVLENAGKSESLSPFETGNYYVQTAYSYIISIVAFIGYLLARDDRISAWRLNSDNVLLVAGGCGDLLLVLFETADSIAGFLSVTNQERLTEEILYFVKVLFYYIGIYCQIMLIMKARQVSKGPSQRLSIIKGIIIFLGVCNTERWLVDSFLPPINLRYINEIQKEDTLGVRNWWFITEFLFPVVTFYRLISALLCLEVKYRLQEIVP